MMTRTAMIVGTVAMFFVAIGVPGLSLTPASAAEMMKTDKAMMKATGDDLMALKNELAMVQAELQKLSARVGGMSRMVDSTTSNYCQSIPHSLRAAGFAPGICR